MGREPSALRFADTCEFCSRIGRPVALPAQGDVARGVRNIRVPLPIPEGALDLYLLLDKDAPWRRLLSAACGRGVAGYFNNQTTYGRILFFFRRSSMCFCDARPRKRIVELKGAEAAAATVPPAFAPTAKGAYGRPHPHVVADSIDFDVCADAKEMDLRRSAAENAHRQAQAGVAQFLFILGEGAWSVIHSPWPVIGQEFSIAQNARRQ
jgi:hypothetical protein